MRRVVRYKFGVAFCLLVSVTAIASDDVGYRMFREGYSYWRAGNAVKAYAIFDSIDHTLPPIDDLRLYATAETARKTGRGQRATTLFEKLLRDYPASPWCAAAQKALSQSESAARAEGENLSRVERLQKAAQLLKQDLPLDAAVLIEPLVNVSGKSVRGDTDVLDMLATAYFRGRDYKKAVPVLVELLKRNGEKDLPLMTTLASAYARSNRYDEAIALQRKIMDSPLEARRALYKIVFLEADRNHDKEAIVAAREYLGRYPNGAERNKVMWIVAWSYLRLKEWPAALTHLESYRDAVGSHDEKRRAEYWIARTLEWMGNKTGAMTAYGVISGQSALDYYGHLASSHLRHKPLAWLLPLPHKFSPGKLDTDSASALLNSLGLYEFAPVMGWDGSYRDLIERAAPVAGLTPSLVNSIMQVESHFRQDAISPAGAMGLMQLIPSTAYQLSDEIHLDVFVPKKLLDPIWNVTLGMEYLRKLSVLFARQMVPMIASYNAGEQAVQRWVEKASLTDPEMFIEEIPYDETYAYVKHVLTLVW